MLTAYAILVLCNVVPEASRNISQEKVQANQGMLFEEHLVTFYICIYKVFHVEKKYKFISSLTFYRETGQNFSRTLSKKVKHSASHAMLSKTHVICLAVSVKCRDQDCMSN